MAARAWLRLVVVASAVLALISPHSHHSGRPMTIHNRILLNRAAVAGLTSIEVMLLASDNRLDRVKALVAGARGRIGYSNDHVGYVRAKVPIAALLDVVSDPAVAAYQISSHSKGGWHHDLPTERDANVLRDQEARPTAGSEMSVDDVGVPLLSVDESAGPGFTADEDAGVGEWIRQHATYDGRGVTIALLETAQPEFNHPTLRTATTIDGRTVSKIAGIVNAFDPEDYDATRVLLDVAIDATSTWKRIGDRTYILPRRGAFRFGMFVLPAGAHLFHRFGVIQDQETGEILVDANGNADFRDDRPMADVNTRVDIGVLKLLSPRAMDLSFVVAKGERPDTVHVYVSRGDHYAMVASVAAGSRTEDGLASGAAPGARVLLVRHAGGVDDLRHLIEGYLHAAERPDVDVLGAATGFGFLPDTAHEFAGLFFSRVIARWGKPIFQSAGNLSLRMNQAHSLGDAFTVGGSLAPSTFASFFGGAELDSTIVHPSSAAGPALDGGLTPDFIAPMHLVAASLWNSGRNVLVPRNAPTRRLPPGYQVSCCTSASGPYGAGVAALLISAAKQTGVPHSFDRLSRALRVGARFLDGWPAHQQGSGVMTVETAWRELQNLIEVPRIRVSASVVHPLARYSNEASVGQGLFEWEGWSAGTGGRRQIAFFRETGPKNPISYQVSITGSDGTFSVPASVTLPLASTVVMPIDISVRTSGAHSAIVNLHDTASGAIMLRVPATIVATERIDPRTMTLTLSGTVGLMRRNAHYVAIPEHVGALVVELEVFRGSTMVSVLPAHGLYSPQDQVRPMPGRVFTKGRYTLVFPSPSAGTWTFDADNVTLRREGDRSLVSGDPVEYAFTLRLQRATLTVHPSSPGGVASDVAEVGGTIREPVIQTSLGTLTSQRSTTLPTGMPNLYEIDVPRGSSTLAVSARVHKPVVTGIELHLYDCTSSECFSYDFTLPSSSKAQIVVRRPKPGRWIAAVNAGPVPSAVAPFDVDVLIAESVTRHPMGRSRFLRLPALAGSNQVLLSELIDASAERDEIDHPWEVRRSLPKRPHAPVAIASAIHAIR